MAIACPRNFTHAHVQVIVMFLLGGVFKIERQSGLEWLIAVLIGAGSIPFDSFIMFISPHANMLIKLFSLITTAVSLYGAVNKDSA